jgi:hypothetical protein
MQYNKALRFPGKLMLQLPYQSIELGKIIAAGYCSSGEMPINLLLTTDRTGTSHIEPHKRA